MDIDISIEESIWIDQAIKELMEAHNRYIFDNDDELLKKSIIHTNRKLEAKFITAGCTPKEINEKMFYYNIKLFNKLKLYDNINENSIN